MISMKDYHKIVRGLEEAALYQEDCARHEISGSSSEADRRGKAEEWRALARRIKREIGLMKQ